MISHGYSDQSLSVQVSSNSPNMVFVPLDENAIYDFSKTHYIARTKF